MLLSELEKQPLAGVVDWPRLRIPVAQGVGRRRQVERHPAAKDHTDLELAMDEAVASDARHIVVLGGDGGRRDHLFANLLVLASPHYARAGSAIRSTAKRFLQAPPGA